MPETEIDQARTIISDVQKKYGYDFSRYALTSFRYAIDRSIIRHHLKYPEVLSNRILEDDEFFDEFLFEINDVKVELFRDSETWIFLKSTIFPQFFENFDNPIIWIPGACNGQDLYSLLILLKIEFPGKTITIYVSAISEKTIGIISRGEILPKLLESGLENFEKVFPDGDIHSFLKQNKKEYILDYSLFQGINIIKQDLLFEPHPVCPGLIFFRNNLLNYTPEHQNTILELLTSILDINGYLITGIKENIDDYIATHQNLLLIDKREKVYKKIK